MKHKHLSNLGDEIRLRRRLLKLSQESLAEKSGFHRNYVGKVERGEQNLTVTNLFRIAEALEYPADKLLQKANFPEESS